MYSHSSKKRMTHRVVAQPKVVNDGVSLRVTDRRWRSLAMSILLLAGAAILVITIGHEEKFNDAVTYSVFAMLFGVPWLVMSVLMLGWRYSAIIRMDVKPFEVVFERRAFGFLLGRKEYPLDSYALSPDEQRLMVSQSDGGNTGAGGLILSFILGPFGTLFDLAGGVVDMANPSHLEVFFPALVVFDRKTGKRIDAVCFEREQERDAAVKGIAAAQQDILTDRGQLPNPKFKKRGTKGEKSDTKPKRRKRQPR